MLGLYFMEDVYIKLGGLDYSYSKPGEPGIGFDHDICYRAWQNGWQVGLYSCNSFNRRVGIRGTKVFGSSERKSNDLRNLMLLTINHGSKIKYIQKTTGELNKKLLKNNI